jgi:hypothetical protein
MEEEGGKWMEQSQKMIFWMRRGRRGRGLEKKDAIAIAISLREVLPVGKKKEHLSLIPNEKFFSPRPPPTDTDRP